MPKPAEWQRLRHQHSVASMGAEMPAVPNLVIRRPSVVAGGGVGCGVSVIGLAGLKDGRKFRSALFISLPLGSTFGVAPLSWKYTAAREFVFGYSFCRFCPLFC